MKKKVTLLILIIVILIISGGIIYFIINFQTDKKNTAERMKKIINTYEKFEKRANEFSSARDDLYTNFLSNVYYDNLKENMDLYKSKIKSYEEVLNNIEKETIILKKNCHGVYYPNSDVNSKCQVYGITYEKIVNYFVSDINQINKTIKEYNSYQQENKTNEPLIEKYKTNKKYIDYNQDNKYEGKDED